MKHRLFFPLVVSAAILSGAVLLPKEASSLPPQDGPQQHRFRIAKLNNQWKVHDSKDSRTRVIRAKRGDVVYWTAAGSDLYFQFPDSTLFESSEAAVADGKELALTVSKNAAPGRYTYSVFCMKERKFATGDSPPVIIIR